MGMPASPSSCIVRRHGGQDYISRLRATDRGARIENRRTAFRAGRYGSRYIRRDRTAFQKKPATDQGNLFEAHTLAGVADRAPSAAALHDGLRERDIHRLP